jgi:hypothetical protein
MYISVGAYWYYGGTHLYDQGRGELSWRQFLVIYKLGEQTGRSRKMGVASQSQGLVNREYIWMD